MLKQINIVFDPLKNYDKVYIFFENSLYYESALQNISKLKDTITSVLSIKQSDANKSLLFLVKKGRYNEIVETMKKIEVNIDKVENMSPDAREVFSRFGVMKENDDAEEFMKKLRILRGEN